MSRALAGVRPAVAAADGRRAVVPRRHGPLPAHALLVSRAAAVVREVAPVERAAGGARDAAADGPRAAPHTGGATGSGAAAGAASRRPHPPARRRPTRRPSQPWRRRRCPGGRRFRRPRRHSPLPLPPPVPAVAPPAPPASLVTVPPAPPPSFESLPLPEPQPASSTATNVMKIEVRMAPILRKRRAARTGGNARGVRRSVGFNRAGSLRSLREADDDAPTANTR